MTSQNRKVRRTELSPDSFKQEDLLIAEVKPEVGLRRYQVVTEDGKYSGETKNHLEKPRAFQLTPINRGAHL